MRVLHVIPALALRHGGPTFAVVDMVQALRNAGIATEILCTEEHSGRRADTPWPEGYPPWVHVLRRGPLSGYAYSPELVRWLEAHLSDYDLIHVHALFRYSAWVTGLLARRLNIPYVVTPHGALDDWGMRRRMLLKRLHMLVADLPLMAGAAAVHCASQAEADSPAVRRLRRPVYVIPHGVSLRPSLHPGSAAGETVLFLSRLDPKKRPELLFRALALLVDRHPNLRCVVAGTGKAAYERTLRRMVARLGLTDRVTFAGFVVGVAKQALFDNADLFVLPSRDESFGIAVVEAMAAGVPAMVTRGVALSAELERYQAGVVVDDSAFAIADAVDLLLREPQRARQLARNARRLMMRHFAWHAVTSKLCEMYRELLDAGSKRASARAENHGNWPEA